MSARPRFSFHSSTALALLVLIAVLLVLLALAIHRTPAPAIETALDGAPVDIRADRAWALHPSDCVNVTWNLSGARTIHVDGRSESGSGMMAYCPSLQATSLSFQWVATNGDHQDFTLDFRYLPLEFFRCLSLTTILVLLFVAAYCFATIRFFAPLRIQLTHLLAGLALLTACLLCQTVSAFLIESLLDEVSRVFSHPAWHGFGLLLAGLVFLPLAGQALQTGLKNRSRADFIAIVAFLLFVLLLYLPFGFDSVGHWEEWVIRAYLEKDQFGVWPELVSRFWLVIPNALANHISPQSFAGYHLVNFLMFWGRLTLFYCILRKLKLNPLFAFLTSILFLAYPVNTHLMSLRQIMINASVLALMAAVLFCLEYVARPSRWRLAGIWLATLLNIGSYESGYAIIAVIPLLWWWRSPRWTWRNVNVTVIWYLFPIAKIVFILLLLLDSRQFYGSEMVSEPGGSQQIVLGSVAYYAGMIEGIYRQTFWNGWRDALSALSQSAWIAPTLAALTLTGGVAAYLARSVNPKTFPFRRQMVFGLLAGALFVLPAVGVLMWFNKYSTDMWRPYIFVPVSGAIVVFSLILLVAALIKKHRIRQTFIIGLCLMAMFPAIARLFAQHAFHVNSANNKAKILLQIVEQAPAIDSDAYVILLTELLGTELRARGVSEFRTGALRSALRVLYQDPNLEYAFICIIDKRCFLDEYSRQGFDLQQSTDFSNVVLFRLDEDLSVELLQELPPELSREQKHGYKPERLIDTSAPLPPRALTMLASAHRG